MREKTLDFSMPHKLIIRSLFYSCLKDALKSPKKELFSTSERNIASHIRASLEIFKDFYEPLLHFQVDTEYNRVGVGDSAKKRLNGEHGKVRVIPDIIIHKRGESKEESKDANYLCIEIKIIKNFNGTLNDIRNKEKKRRLSDDLEKLRCFRRDKNYEYTYGASIVISNPHTIFLKLNDKDYVKCSIKEVPLKMRKRFMELIDRVMFITQDYYLSEKKTYRAKIKVYEWEIDQIIASCLV